MYHPDKQINNPNDASKFIAINEAYAVLSNPNKRKVYDYNLLKKNLNYFKNYSYEHDAFGIIEQIKLLQTKVASVYPDDINQIELTYTILHFYNSDYYSIINAADDASLKENYLNTLTVLIHLLRYKHVLFVYTNIKDILAKEEETLLMLYKILKYKRKQATIILLKPLLFLLCAFVICFFIYYLSNIK